MLKSEHPTEKNKLLPIVSWAFYDFANTIFSILVVTRYLPPLLKEITGGSSAMGTAVAFSMVCAGGLVPLLGAVSDRTGKSKEYLFASTLLCVTAVSFLSFEKRTSLILLLFFIANLAYQVSMVFYNSLLPWVCTEEKKGTVSGLGVALGYVGSFLAILAAKPYVKVFGVRMVFFFAGVLFFIFSLPLFFAVRGRREPSFAPVDRTSLLRQIRRVVDTFRGLSDRPSILFFLLGSFFCLDAVNTTIVFYSEYLLKARGISASGVDTCLIAVQLSALGFSLLIGRWTDKTGPKAMILSVTGAWILAIGIILTTKGLHSVVLASIIGGFGLGGIWVTGRVLILELAPRAQRGEFLGLYGMTGKFSAVGAMVFGFLADLFSYDTALAFQLFMLGMALYFFSRVDMTAS